MMEIRKFIIAKNAGILLVTDILGKVLRTVLAVIIARKLGASDLGLLAYAVAFTEMFSFIPDFGFKNFINREVAKYPERSGQYFSNIAFIKGILSLITFSIILILSYVMGMESHQFVIVILTSIVMLFNSYIQFYTAFYRGFQKAEYEALVLMAEHIFVVLTGIVVVSIGYGLFEMMWIRLIVLVFVFIIGFIILKSRILSAPYTINLTQCKDLIKSAVPFTFLSVVIIINAQIGIVLLTQMKGTLYSGYYSAALKICGIFQFLPASVAGAILPAMTKYAQKNQFDHVVETFNKSLKYLLLLVLPIAAGICILADRFIILIYDAEFFPSILTLRILIWLIVLSFSNTIFNVVFASIGKEKLFLAIQVTGIVLFILLNIILIPIIEHNGVAVAIIVSQVIVFGASAILMTRYFKKINILSILYKPGLAVLAMTACIFLANSLNLFSVILLAVAVYGLCLILLRILDDEEITLIKTGIRKVFKIRK